jgi:hypothetical protein
VAVILRIVAQVLAIVLDLVGISNLIRQNTQNAAQEHQPYAIEGIVTTAGLSIANPTYGLAAAHTERQAILTAIAALNAPVLSAIAALPAGSDIVIPPAGDNAEAVWLYQGDWRTQTGNMLSKLDETNFKLGPSAGYLAPATPWFALYYPTSFID